MKAHSNPMRYISLYIAKSLAIVLLNLAWLNAYPQIKYTAANIHSHNDYTRPAPFYKAFNAEVGAIEADVYLRKGHLMVAHDTADINPARTLKALYLQPLIKTIKSRPGHLNLLIDFKEPYNKLLPQLLRELEPLIALLKTGTNKSKLTIIITGNRPPPAAYKNYPQYILFDDDLQQAHTPQQWSRVAQVSLNFGNYSKWQGNDLMPAYDEKLVRATINAVHNAGKKIRFWNAPDNKAGWRKLMDLNADIINTDKIDELIAFLNGRR
jgi:hypothetical protein